MKNLQAFTIMGAWTILVLSILYVLDAQENYRSFFGALAISAALLGAHVVNMAIYFRIAGNEPYRWFK